MAREEGRLTEDQRRMGGSPRERSAPFLWNPRQRGVLIVFVLVFAVILLVRLAGNPVYVSHPQPTRPARFSELVDTLDPNVATWQELSVLPQIGEKRAKQLVAYREDFVGRGSGTVAFARAEDLLKVRGFGVATIATIRPYLAFPATQPTTRGS